MQTQTRGSLTELSPATRRGIIYIALAQGLLLLGMHELIDRAWWPGTSIPLRTLWYTLSLAVPSAAWMLLRDLRDRRLWLMLAAYGVLLVPMALYTGMQYDSTHDVEAFQLFAPYVMSQLAIWFVVTYFMDLKLDGESWVRSGRDVCAYTWRHGIALGLLALFLGVLWLLLFLWGALFKVLNIGVFQELFENRRFIYPAFGLAGGFAVVVLRGQFDAVGLLERIASALLRVLLPLLALIVLLFLGALPFTGLQLLWKAGLGTPLMMWLVCLMLAFVNVSFYGQQARYPLWLRLPIYVALTLLPVYLALCAWGIGLRVAQHGWSLERLWGVVILGLLAIFVLSYTFAVLRKRDHWLEWLPHINRSAGAVAAALLILICLPVLNLPGIAARDQVDRLLAGKVDPAKFDYSYLRFRLGEPGYQQALALQKSPFMAGHPAELAKLGQVLNAKNFWAPQIPVAPTAPAEIAKSLPVYPGGEPVPPELLIAIAATPLNAHCFAAVSRCEIVGIDLRGDHGREYLLFSSTWYGEQPIYALVGGRWEEIASFSCPPQKGAPVLQHALETGTYKFESPEYPDLVIGDKRLQIRPTTHGNRN